MTNERLRTEFNSWADAGRGERMARGHRPATEQAISLLAIEPSHRVLDLGCGIGWAVRLMAARCVDGEAVGIDISDKMIERARDAEDNPPNVRFDVATAERLSFADGEFDRVLSVESLYYYDDMAKAVRETARVMRPGGRFAVVVDYYGENVESHRWADEIAVPMHLLSTREYRTLLDTHGFEATEARRLFDPSPIPSKESFQPTWGFPTYDSLLRFREEGTLLVLGTRTREAV